MSLRTLSILLKGAEFKTHRQLVAYGEFRCAFEGDVQDQRILFYGMRYLIENYIAVPWTEEDVEMAATFFARHHAGQSAYPFPKDLFLKFIRENKGYFPVKIESLPEGTVVYPHVPGTLTLLLTKVYQITAEKEYARLVTYLETLLTMIWYPTTVATLSRRCRNSIEESYQKTVDPEGMWSLDSRLHDFGFRGCTSVEQSIIGGCAHLINFSGTDTMSAAFYAQFKLNHGKPVGFSIPATEHSIMTAHQTERDAMICLLENFGSGVCACVMDSYDYKEALEKVLPSVASLAVKKGGFLVLRPDSGDPVEVVLMALRAADHTFGSDINQKGYKVRLCITIHGQVIRGAGVIQGDGISYRTLKDILIKVEEAGFSAQCVAFGMGGGLLQKVNRDTMSFATKLSKIVYADGVERDVMKMPKTGKSKFSLPGELSIHRNHDQLPVVYPAESKANGPSDLVVVYDHGPVYTWDSFDTVRARAAKEWARSPPVFDPISIELKEKIKRTMAAQEKLNQKSVG